MIISSSDVGVGTEAGATELLSLTGTVPSIAASGCGESIDRSGSTIGASVRMLLSSDEIAIGRDMAGFVDTGTKVGTTNNDGMAAAMGGIVALVAGELIDVSVSTIGAVVRDLLPVKDRTRGTVLVDDEVGTDSGVIKSDSVARLSSGIAARVVGDGLPTIVPVDGIVDRKLLSVDGPVECRGTVVLVEIGSESIEVRCDTSIDLDGGEDSLIIGECVDEIIPGIDTLESMLLSMDDVAFDAVMLIGSTLSADSGMTGIAILFDIASVSFIGTANVTVESIGPTAGVLVVLTVSADNGCGIYFRLHSLTISHRARGWSAERMTQLIAPDRSMIT